LLFEENAKFKYETISGLNMAAPLPLATSRFCVTISSVVAKTR